MNYRNRALIQSKHPEIFEALEDFAAQVDRSSDQTNVGQDPPPGVASLTVTAAQGIFDVAIFDNTSPVKRGVNYFVEYSLSPSFNSAYVVDLGASRNWRGNLGNLTLYWRAYSQYTTGAKSNYMYFGTEQNPTAVIGGGTSTGPVPLPSNGSGTSSGFQGGDGGFGNRLKR